ncbi:MAG: type I restriction endonuclease subunit M [Rhodoferax sp.]
MKPTDTKSGTQPQRRPLFDLGQIVATPGALATLKQYGIDPLHLLTRHVTGDWGDVDAMDAVQNDRSVERGLRILSSYRLAPLATLRTGSAPPVVWIITEADRSATTFLLPEEY